MKGGMSVDELRDMRAAWQHVLGANLGDISAGFLLEWWEKEPTAIALFPQFKDKPLAELKPLPRVRVNGSHIFLAISGILLNLENDEVSCELLADLKKDHVKFQPTLSSEAYHKYSDIALAYLTKKFDTGMTPLAVSGFTKLYKLLGHEGGMHK
jgi:hypothetical protein